MRPDRGDRAFEFDIRSILLSRAWVGFGFTLATARDSPQVPINPPPQARRQLSATPGEFQGTVDHSARG